MEKNRTLETTRTWNFSETIDEWKLKAKANQEMDNSFSI
jgi:hypothetical protein